MRHLPTLSRSLGGSAPSIRLLCGLLLLGSTTVRAESTGARGLAPLLGHIWLLTDEAQQPSPHSIYIFLASGTLLETSCTETYRIAIWKADPKRSDTLVVTEDGRPAFTAVVSIGADGSVHLKKTLALGNHDVSTVSLTALDREFVCPDLPR